MSIRPPIRVPCRFGCKLSPAIGIYLAEFKGAPGCICWPDHVQALCAQHVMKAEGNGVILDEIVSFREEEEECPDGC